MTQEPPNEEWRPVVGWEGYYEVSSLGRVKRLQVRILRSDGRTVNSKSGILTPHTRQYGHEYVSLFKEGVRKTVAVHRTVCETFWGPPPEDKPWALHWDDNPSNNRPENLRWGDAFDNQKDSVRNGTHVGVKKKFCPRGHLLNGENLYVYPRGSRTCRECMRQATRNWRASRKGLKG